MPKNNKEKAESFRLDLKDRKILYELDSNARQSCSKIAKKVGLSTEVVNYRIKKFEQEGIITQYQLIVNLAKLGIVQFKICLALQHLDSTKLEEILGSLKKNNSVKWIVSCNGNWDIIISLETDSLEKVNELKNDILGAFENYIDRKAVSILVEAETYGRNYLIDKKEEYAKRSRIIMKTDEKTTLDDVDLEILKKLSENARKSIIDLASELKMSVRVVEYRIKQLLKKEIILGFKVALNYEKLGIHFYKVFVYLDSPKKERVDQLIRYFEHNKNIIHHVKVIGNWDFEPEFEVYSEEEFDKILNEIKDKFSDIIKKADVLTISKEHKFVYF